MLRADENARPRPRPRARARARPRRPCARARARARARRRLRVGLGNVRSLERWVCGLRMFRELTLLISGFAVRGSPRQDLATSKRIREGVQTPQRSHKTPSARQSWHMTAAAALLQSFLRNARGMWTNIASHDRP